MNKEKACCVQFELLRMEYTAVVKQIILDINSYLIVSFVLMISLSTIRRLRPKPSDISPLSSGLFHLQAWTSPLDLTRKVAANTADHDQSDLALRS